MFVVVTIGKHVDLVDEAGPVSELLAKVSLLTEVVIAYATGVKLMNGMIAVLTYGVVREHNLLLLPDHLFFVRANPRKFPLKQFIKGDFFWIIRFL